MNTDHPSPAAGVSQCEAILRVLTDRAGQWVPMPLLASRSGGYAVHSRIADLRRRGHRVDHRNLRIGRRIHSEYRLSD
jgi:hypothetical protein